MANINWVNEGVGKGGKENRGYVESEYKIDTPFKIRLTYKEIHAGKK